MGILALIFFVLTLVVNVLVFLWAYIGMYSLFEPKRGDLVVYLLPWIGFMLSAFLWWATYITMNAAFNSLSP